MHESALADAGALDTWMDEACRILDNKDFEHLFNPSAYREALNELPIMYLHENRSVYGLIDRLVFTADHILLIDYKTHQTDNDSMLDSLVDTYRSQMNHYRTGVEKLWPDQKIKSGLLFTYSARLVWLDQDS